YEPFANSFLVVKVVSSADELAAFLGAPNVIVDLRDVRFIAAAGGVVERIGVSASTYADTQDRDAAELLYLLPVSAPAHELVTDVRFLHISGVFNYLACHIVSGIQSRAPRVRVFRRLREPSIRPHREKVR